MTGLTRPLRVLIADDHRPTREDVRRALERDERFDVCAEASDAPTAVQAAVREKPDMCVLDVRMPGGGVAAAWEISARLPQAKIVMLTVTDADSDLFAALWAGAAGYLLKSMNMDRLPDALAGVYAGEAAMHRPLVARVLKRFHGGEPRRRQPETRGPAQQRLTSREWEVLDLLAQGLSTAEIARRLVLSASAVRVHVAAVVRKLGVRDRAAAAELFRRDQLAAEPLLSAVRGPTGSWAHLVLRHLSAPSPPVPLSNTRSYVTWTNPHNAEVNVSRASG